MSAAVDRAALYRGRINLWVEDEFSREYLSGLWNDASAAFFVAGGNDGVGAVVKDAEAAGFLNVFGVIDRDFRRSDRPTWDSATRTSRRYILPCHEIENYLLDPAALGASRLNNRGRTGAEIEADMTSKAGELAWWSACCEVVAELKRRFLDDLITHPPRSIRQESEAFEHITGSAWFRGLGARVARSSADDVRDLLRGAHGTALQRVGDGTWRHEFAGKEILRDVESRICDRTKLQGGGRSSAEVYVDIAKDVASWQATTGRVPQDLADLLAALKRRIAGVIGAP